MVGYDECVLRIVGPVEAYLYVSVKRILDVK